MVLVLTSDDLIEISFFVMVYNKKLKI